MLVTPRNNKLIAMKMPIAKFETLRNSAAIKKANRTLTVVAQIINPVPFNG